MTPEFRGRSSTVQDVLQIYLRWNWGGAILLPTDEGESGSLLSEAAAVTGPLTFRVGFWASPVKEGNLTAFQNEADKYAVLKIHPSFLRITATDASLRPYCETAQRLGMPIVVHCGRWKEVAGFELALELANTFHGTPVILSHMGGDSPHLAMAAVEQIADQRIDNAFLGTESIREPWILEHALARLGASRLIFGSDHNLNHPEPFRRLIEVLDITDADRDLIMGRNIDALLPERRRF